MLLKLIRKQVLGDALCGELYIDGTRFCDTLERTPVAIPAGFYPVTLTLSPRFGEVLPLIGNVIGRTGIRIHAGNSPRDTNGCILVGEKAEGLGQQEGSLYTSRRTLNRLRDILSNAVTPSTHEPLYIEIIEPDPYPLYDVPCPPCECMRYLEEERIRLAYRHQHPDEFPPVR